MKTLFLLPLVLIPVLTKAQTLVATETQALLTVLVTDNNKKPLQGETVSFVSKKDKKSYSGITKENGKFEMLVPEGDKYDVQYKAFTENESYNVMDIPSVEGTVNFEYDLVINPPKTYTLNDVFFDTGKSTLKPESAKELNKLAEYLQLKKNLKVEIAGHTDNVGNAAANQNLSEDRANAVRDFLIKKGIAAARVTAKGYGDTQPVADNTNEDGRKKNRRTEVRNLD